MYFSALLALIKRLTITICSNKYDGLQTECRLKIVGMPFNTKSSNIHFDYSVQCLQVSTFFHNFTDNYCFQRNTEIKEFVRTRMQVHKKSAREDSLTAEHLKYGGNCITLWLAEILNAIVDSEQIPACLKA